MPFVDIFKLVISECSWPFVILILGSIFLLTQINSLGKLIKKITSIDFSKNKSETTLSIHTNEIPETFPVQIDESDSEDKILELEKLLNIKDYDLLDEEVKKWKKTNKKAIHPYIYKGRALMRQFEYVLAEKEFKKALKINKNHSEIYYYLGMIPLKKNDLENAKKYLIKAYNFDENDPRITLALSYTTYYSDRDIDKSLKFIRSSHDNYENRKEKYPHSEVLNFSIHQSMEYYLANKGGIENFKEAFEIDEYLENIWQNYIDENIISEEDQAFTLDTRGYLRYRAVEENYRTENKKDLILSSIDFFMNALELIPLDKEITEHLIKTIKLSKE